MHDCDLHDIGMSTFQQIQADAMNGERAQMLTDQAVHLELLASNVDLPPARRALQAEALRMRRKATTILATEDMGRVLSMPAGIDLSDASTTTAQKIDTLEKSISALEASMKLAPEGAIQGLLTSAQGLRTQLDSLRSGVTTPPAGLRGWWSGLNMAVKAMSVAATLAAGYGAYRLYSSRKAAT